MKSAALLLALILAGVLAVGGCAESKKSKTDSAEVAADEDKYIEVEPQEDWENQEGDAWDEFVSGYESGYSDGCYDTVNVGLHGAVFYEEESYDETDCGIADASSTEVPIRLPRDPEIDGEDLGYADGCNSIFDAASEETLFDGLTYVTRSDCESNPVTSTERVTGSGTVAPATSEPSEAEKAASGEVSDCVNFSMEGIENGPGAGWYDISVRGTSCTAVRQMLLGDTNPNSQEIARSVGFTCSKLGSAGETAQYRCVNGDTAFRYSWGA